MPISKPFSALSKEDVEDAGGKGASLGEMAKAGIPVPPGFVVLASTFDRFLQETDLNVEIDATLHTVNHQEIHTVEQASAKIQALIKGVIMPQDIAEDVHAQFKALGAEHVAVRSSATAEDSASAAWAGQLDSFLNTTEETLLQNVQNCWASLFTPRAIFYRFEKDLHHQHISVAVVIQKMVASDASGIAFSVHPVTEDRNQLIIEAGFGLGEAIVSGQVTPDSYVVEKNPRRIIDINVSHQTRAIYRAETGGNEWHDLAPVVGESQVLTEPQIQELSDLILRIEQHYGFPCDIEWAMERGIFYIVQSRPITTLKPEEESVPVEKNGVIFKKAYSRDTTLFMQELWAKGLVHLAKEKCGWENPHLPFITHYVNDGIVEIWEHEKAIDWLLNQLVERNTSDPQFLKDFFEEYKALLPKLKAIHARGSVADSREQQEYIDLIYQAAFVMTLFFYTGMDDRSPTWAQELAVHAREIVDLFAENDLFARTQIAKIGGISEELAAMVLPGEIQNIPPRDILEKRLQSFVLVDGEVSYVGTLDSFATDHPEYLFEGSLFTAQVNEIRGEIANRGIVHGIARIVKKRSQMDKVRKGDVLVSPMTTPDLLPAMQLASGFVTDEGGITCHAAIMAREMKKPCIIGTKIATQVLHDGDEVEVDADNGIVRILNRAQNAESKNRTYIRINQDVDTSVLTLENVWRGVRDTRIKEQIGISEPDAFLEVVNGSVINYYTEEEPSRTLIQTCADAVLTNQPLLDELKEKTLKHSNEIWAYANDVREQIETCPVSDYPAILARAYEIQAECTRFGMVVAFADVFGAVTERLMSVFAHRKNLPHPASYYATVLGAPEVLSYTEQAYADIRQSNASNEEFQKKYFWLDQGYIGTGLTHEQITHIRESVAPLSNAAHGALQKELSLTEQEAQLFRTVQDIIFIKTIRTEARQALFVIVNRMLKRLAAEYNVPAHLLGALTTQELIAVIDGTASLPTNLEERWTHAVIMKSGDGCAVLTGSEADAYVKMRVIPPKTENNGELKGQVAQSGTARGTVKLVFGPQHNGKVEDGDILISTATSPQLLPAMKKAAAFITDVGGITSHAAIVARELKKPCIVGTKIATQVLHDGDEVEVDANAGIVRMLKCPHAC